MTKKRLGSLIAFAVLVSFLLGGGIYLRNFILGQVSKRIQAIVSYSAIHLHAFPPSLVLEDVRTVSQSPFFSAKSVSAVLPFRSLFKNQKPLTVFIDRPVIRLSPSPQGRSAKARSLPALPFAIEKGVIRGGEFSYLGGKESFEAKDIMAIVSLKDQALVIRMEAGESSVRIKPERKSLEGRMTLLLESRGTSWNISRFVLAGRDIWIKAQGSLLGQPDPRGTLRVLYRGEMDSIAKILGFPFEWGGRVEGEGDLTRTQGEIKFTSGFGSRDMAINRVPLEAAAGNIEYSTVRGIHVEMNMQSRAGPESVLIHESRGRVEGELRGFRLESILAMGSLSWPVRSSIWGKFTLDDRRLLADVDLRETFSGPAGSYPFSGPLRFVWDRKKEFQFSSPRLETTFGRFSFRGTYALGGAPAITINGEVDDVKEAREFTSLALSQNLKFPEIRGSGIASIEIGGAPSESQVKIEFALSPAGIDKQDVEAAEGLVEIRKKHVSGQFRVDDPDFKGSINLLNSPQGLDVGVKMAEGDLSRIVSGLNLRLALRGTVAGDIQVRRRQEALWIDGTFSSPLIRFGGQELRAVAGRLNWDGDSIAFPELAFDIFGGRVKSSWRMGVKTDEVDLDAAGEQINLSVLRPDLAGELSFNLQGRGKLDGTDMAAGGFSVKGLHFGPFPQVDSQGSLRLRMTDKRLGLTVQGSLASDENDFAADVDIPLAADSASVDVKGGFSNLDLLFPWPGVKGRLDYEARVRGIPSSTHLTGAIKIRGPVLPFPQFSQALTDYSGQVNVEGGRFLIQSLTGKLGGGDFTGSGEVTLRKGGEIGINCSFGGKGMLLSPLERTRALTDASLRLIRDAKRFVLEGDVAVRRLSWRREIQEKFSFSSRPYPKLQEKPGFFDDLALNIRLKADDNAWMSNSLGQIRGRFDLSITGEIKAPILLGTIDTLSGEVIFQDRKFQILRGRLSFFNPSSIEPYLDFRAETYVKDYRVTVTLSGLPRQLIPQFSSSPPLPPEDVLALLAQGEAYKRQYRTETSSQLGTASLVSFTLTEGAQRRAEKLFSLDRFRIDPFLLGSSAEMTARLTVGKRISKDLYIYYSTNLTRQTEEIIRLEWDLSNQFSLVGTRNEIGRLSFDVKVRRRF
jgi:TamB, inner membrane protein subunit of TAM complex